MTKKDNVLTPSRAIQKSYLRKFVETADLEKFRSKLEILLTDLKATDTEENNKGRVKTFLEQTLWQGEAYEVNPVGKTDLVIKDKILDRNVVLFEFKKVGVTEMVTKDELNRKAMHELVLYYLIEEIESKNTNIKHLIITDGYQYFVFEKSLFWELFGSHKKFCNEVLSSEHTDSEKRVYIYEQIIKPRVETIKDKLVFTYFNLNDFKDSISDTSIVSKPRFKAIYKFFSPIHLQKLQFSEDHNTLNSKFYTELLYIMGLEERGKEHHIQRLKENERQEYSLVEQVYTMLADYDTDNIVETQKDVDNRFEIALGLVIVWVNRTLFMKLLESQLIAFNKKNKKKYAFFEKLTDFAMMHYLFCKVMAIPEKDRSDEMKQKFGEIPYLNSSLFELSEVEKKYFPVSSLRDGKIKILKKTALKENDKVASGEIKILDYLKRFLDSYDFGAETGESGKTLINASVLGLIFEKINGYKDGSFFTPGYITSYLCHEVLRRCVLDKYNEKFHTSFTSFDDLTDNFENTKENRDAVNGLINGIKVCDPAVGSGHFVVSALNEFIAIKRELGVLQYRDGKKFNYNVNIEDDELIVTDADGEELKYDYIDPESQRVQETLFEEKRIIIENCLFGVDLNPNSAEICQLRLWIELLKNAYYGEKDAAGKRHLQTLPNIDINIKCGNSLVMKYDLTTPISQILKGANLTISDYKSHVASYKNSPSKYNKHAVEQDIQTIKGKLEEGYDKTQKEYKDWVKACGEILSRSTSLFPQEEAETKVLENWRQKEAKLRAFLEEVKTRHARLGAFEWRYEYPEILDDKGNFVGFDCIIGNPPYGVSIKDEYRKTVESKIQHVPDFEIYYYFLEIGYKLLKNNGYLGYIIPNMWLMNVGAKTYRTSLYCSWSILELLDCSSFQIFDSATVRNSVLTLQKRKDTDGVTWYRDTRDLSDVTEGKKSNGKDYFSELTLRPRLSVSNTVLQEDFANNWHAALCLNDDEKAIVGKVISAPKLVSDYFDVSQGYIPYRKSDLVKKYGQIEGARIKEKSLWHADTKIDNSYQQEIHGEDITKYSCTPTNTFVKYGSHVGTYVDMKYFSGERLLVQEVINPLTACLVEETYVNKPDIIDIIKKDDNTSVSLEVLWAILNSKLANYYMLKFAPKADKGSFPKVLIADIKNFPLPEKNDGNKGVFDAIESLHSQIIEEKKNKTPNTELIQSLEWQVDNCIFKLYGLTKEADICYVDVDFIDNKPSDSIE